MPIMDLMLSILTGLNYIAGLGTEHIHCISIHPLNFYTCGSEKDLIVIKDIL